MDLEDYQRRAESAGLCVGGGAAVPLAACDLAAAVGAVTSTVRGRLDGSLDQHRYHELVRRELGEVLICAATVCTASGLDLEDIAAAGLATVEDLYGIGEDESRWAAQPVFDAGYPDGERFPRRLAIEFRQQVDTRGRHVVEVTLCSAEPNATQVPDARSAGFRTGVRLGDPLTDNAREADGYRFHDAIHLGFLAVLGWSPNLRSLLRLKRKSDPVTDECEDGARAIFAEEGLAAVLARIAETRHGFRIHQAVTREAIDIARAATTGLEVHEVPGWLWRRAIWQGFRAMHELAVNGCGQLVADLDTRNLTYRPVVVHHNAVSAIPGEAS